jgi:hypothetical protein
MMHPEDYQRNRERRERLRHEVEQDHLARQAQPRRPPRRLHRATLALVGRTLVTLGAYLVRLSGMTEYRLHRTRYNTETYGMYPNGK